MGDSTYKLSDLPAEHLAGVPDEVENDRAEDYGDEVTGVTQLMEEMRLSLQTAEDSAKRAADKANGLRRSAKRKRDSERNLRAAIHRAVRPPQAASGSAD